MESNEIKISYFKHPIYKDYVADENGNIYLFRSGSLKKIKQFNNNGYYMFSIDLLWSGIQYYAHRFVFECLNNRLIEKNKDIDHINTCTIDNRISNLREVSKLTNNLNRFSNEEVEELPEDVIVVEKYNSHLFENLYFSPSNNCLYRSSEGYFFTIPFKFVTRVYVQNIDGYPVQIYLNKLRKNLGFKD